MMRLNLSAAFWLLLSTASAVSSFGTSASPTSMPRPSFAPVRTGNTALPFLTQRGGASDSKSLLSAASDIETASAATTKAISDANLNLLSEKGRQAVLNFIEHDVDGAQQHVYGGWPEPGTSDDDKRRLAEQLADLDSSYPGGLAAYLSKAKTLLKESADGVNPFSEFEALVPEGELLSYDGEGTMSFTEAEQLGIQAMSGAVFVLVAGGLGERLGYSGIKLSLETNLCTNRCYLAVYVSYIKAMQYLARIKMGRDDIRIPLVIMTSGDTDPLTRQLLKDNNNFGMEDDMLTIVTQDKVAALKDGMAGLALEDGDRWTIQTKPHGHGDVHHLLHREGLVSKWEAEGRTHVIFLQDTNALVINSVVPTLGVSVAKGFHMNSICIPRLAGEAAGAITRLEHKSDPTKSLVINVEYNQLDPLLRSQGDCAGDVPDPATGYSPFPGNANNLVIEMGAYAKTLRGEDQGVVLEFVNPKYKDDTRTDFKKPTRLECMMQDIPKLFQKEMKDTVNIGFTMFDRWFTFSPAKNALDAGIDAVKGGNSAPGTMSSAESDKYIQNQRKLKHAGVDLPVTENAEGLVVHGGIPVTPGPRIVLCPSFGITQEEIHGKIQGTGNKITQRSSLVLDGHQLFLKNLDLDGALVIRAADECRVTVDGLKVQNKGWELVDNAPDQVYDEAIAIRGYTMAKHETKEYVFDEPGNYIIGPDGEVKKLD